MEYFIVIILAAASFQSIARLAAIPRVWEFLAALLLVPVCLAGQDRLAGSNLETAMQTLAGPQALGNWCTLVVVQELVVCVAWSKRLAAQADERRIPPWTWFAFVPSLLLPVAATALRLYLFQNMVDYGFRQISAALAVCFPLLCVGLAEGFRLMGVGRCTGILLRLELVFLLLGIFLPVAVHATLEEPAIHPVDWEQTSVVLATLGACILLSMPLCRWLRRRRHRRMTEGNRN
ncbi:MAG: hypothetical protein J6866_06100 [Victivallales bacterium]|nr:hypothetical protein [Victivallales bacterium]